MIKYLYPIVISKIRPYLKDWFIRIKRILEKITEPTNLPLTLNNTVARPFENIKIYGNTEQDGTPTPESPVEIENVTGEIEFKVQNKNIFDMDDFLTKGNVDYTKEDNTYFLNNSGNIIINRYPLKLKPDTTYVFSCAEQEQNTPNVRIQVFKNNFYLGLLQTTGQGNQQFIFTTDSDSQYTINLTWSSPSDYPILFKEPMLEVNTNKTNFIPHAEQTSYFTLEEGQYLAEGGYLSDDGIHNIYGKLVLDGTENWIYEDSGVTGIKSIAYTLGSSMKSGNYMDGKCEYFKNNKSGKEANTVRFGINNTQIGIYVNETDFDSKTAFTNWLSTHNMNVEYPLAEESITPYTESQQAQWNAIKEMTAYDEQTNIDIISNIPAKISLDYWTKGGE